MEYVASKDFCSCIFLLASSTSLLFGQTILSRLVLIWFLETAQNIFKTLTQLRQSYLNFMKWWSIIKIINIFPTILPETLCIDAIANIPSSENISLNIYKTLKKLIFQNLIIASNFVELREGSNVERLRHRYLPPFFCSHLFFCDHFEELQTVFTEVKLIINNGSLTYVYPNTIKTYLTPNH